MPEKLKVRQAQWDLFAGGLIVLHIILTLFVVVRLEVNYWDNLSYLVCAKALLFGDVPFVTDRQPLLPLILIPFFLLEQWGIEGSAYRGPMFLATAVAGMYLACAYVLFRRGLGGGWAFLALLLFAANPMMIHYGPFLGHDLTSAMLLMLLFVLYLRIREKGGHSGLAVAGALMGLVFAARYPMGLAVPIICGQDDSEYPNDQHACR